MKRGAGIVMMGVGLFFIATVAILTVSDAMTEMEPGYRVAGAIQTTSGMIILGIGASLTFYGSRLTKKPKQVTAA